MKDFKNEGRLLASLAVFRELYDSKKEVYGIIAEFLREIIIAKAKHQFNIAEITQLLNASYEFNLPEVVVKTSLDKLDFLEKSKGFYIVKNFAGVKKTDISEKQTEIIKSNSSLIKKLLLFIEEGKEKLNDREQEKVVDSFCSFLLDDLKNQDYFKYISAFVIKNRTDSGFGKQLSIIKEGVILYSGIKYSSNLIGIGSWDTCLTIFIDTELLFYFAGYDGALYETLFIDFLSFINEINQKSSKKLIRLLYFKAVVYEIDSFFFKAEQIVSGKEKLNPSRTAMASICDGCHKASDVVAKKTVFFELLKKNDILEDDYQNYFLPENHKYNISDKATIKKLTNSLGRSDIAEHLKFLNYVSIQRGDAYNNNFENIGYILLSGNSTTERVAWNDEIKKKGSVPLVTNLNFLTAKFWFTLNKGFGPNRSPKSFEVITKAQIILSSQLNDAVSLQYDILQEKFKKEELTEEQAVATIANLRKLSIKPEDIVEDNISNVLSSISEDKIEKYILEKEHLKNEAQRESQENIKLKENLTQKEKKLDEYEKSQTALSSQVIETKETLLQERKNSIEILENQKKPIDIEIAKVFQFFKMKILGAIVLSYALAYFLILKYGWNELEQWTWIISVTLPVIVSAIYMLVKEKTINPLELFKSKKLKIQKQKYNQFNFDISLLDKLKSEKNNLRNEIDELKSQHSTMGKKS